MLQLCVQYAATKVGVVVVGLDPALSAKAVGKVLKDESCRGLVFSDRYNGQQRTPTVQELLPELSAGSWGDMVASKQFRSLRHVITSSFDAARGVTQFAEFPVYGTTDDFLPEVAAAVSDSDVAVVSYGAGADADTPVKGKASTHAELMDAASSHVDALKLTAHDTLVVTAPLSGAGFTAALAGAIAGAKVVLPTREFNADAVAKAAAMTHATALVGAADHVGAVGGDLKTAAV